MRATSIACATAALVAGVFADLHKWGVCVTGRSVWQNPGGTGFSPSMTWNKNYEVNLAGTECACGYYKNRNTGNHQWDKCPDCYFDGLQCVSDGWHIGGDELTHYCRKYCGSEGGEAN